MFSTVTVCCHLLCLWVIFNINGRKTQSKERGNRRAYSETVLLVYLSCDILLQAAVVVSSISQFHRCVWCYMIISAVLLRHSCRRQAYARRCAVPTLASACRPRCTQATTAPPRSARDASLTAGRATLSVRASPVTHTVWAASASSSSPMTTATGHSTPPPSSMPRSRRYLHDVIIITILESRR